MAFYNLDNEPEQSGVAETLENSTFDFSRRVDCKAGKTLKCQAVDERLTVYGRKLGNVPWVNLVTTGIDLTPWANTRQTFEFEIEIDATDDIFSENIGLYLE